MTSWAEKMVRRVWTVFAWSLFITAFGLLDQSRAQGYRGPLTMEGLHEQHNHSAESRGFGGVTIGAADDIGLMFRNPAAMQGLDGIQVSVGGMRLDRDISQVQHFAPVRYYPNLSLLLEGMTDEIPNPDPDLIGFTPADSVQRPFDDITPNWSTSNSSNLPLHALVAAPFTVGDVTLIAGAGMVQYANLNHYYQNNNVLEPDVLTQRPLPTLRPTDDNPVVADWYQSIRSREGTLYGYGGSLAGHIEPYNLTVGISGLVLDGTTDDFEVLQERGTLTFLANEFRADSSFGRLTRTGTSDFSGFELSLSTTLHGEFVSLGVVARPPTQFTRSYRMDVQGDTAGVTVSEAINGEDEMQLPWRGSIGLRIEPRDNLHLGIEYELRPYSSATHTGDSGDESSPWESSSLFRVGVEYAPTSWLALRGGIRGDSEVFIPDGAPINTTPVIYRVYAAGIGLNYAGLQWNIAYEYSDMSYEDIWGSAISNNADVRHVLTTDISYILSFGR